MARLELAPELGVNAFIYQKWQCPVCREPLFNGEPLHTHHVVQVKDGGNDKEENLVHLHQACHQQLHYGENRSKIAEGLSGLMDNCHEPF